MKQIQVFHDHCTGCRLCELVCSFSHENVSNPQKSRIRILKDDEYGNNFVINCFHCPDAPCINACPASALKRNENNAVVVDPNTCIGCSSCIEACPIGALYLDNISQTIFKCDLCNGDPNCVKVCSRKALVLTEQGINLKEIIEMREEVAKQILISQGRK